MTTGIINNFLIPGFLSIEQYSVFKTYGLFLSFIGFFPLGFIDGVYINYGGKRVTDIDRKIFKFEHRVLFYFQLIATIVVIIISYLVKNKILFFFGLTILPFTILGFFKLFFQAINEFTKYTLISVLSVVLIFLFNLILVVFKMKQAEMFILANVLAYYLVFLFVEYEYQKRFFKISVKKDYTLIKNNFKVGIFILIGNLSSLLFYTIDRWFVKLGLDTESFAYYSFAISMMGLVSIFINSVTTIFYPYLSNIGNKETLKKLKNYFLIIGSVSCLSYFVFAFIVNYYIPKYVPALEIIAILFTSFPVIVTLRALYVNLYKVQKRDKLYLKTVIMTLLISVILNFIAIKLWHNYVSIAIATTLSFYIWYLLSSRHFKVLQTGLNEIIFLLLVISSFVISYNVFVLWLGALIFMFSLLILIVIFYKVDAKSLAFEILGKKRFK